MQQNTPEWHFARCGSVTASRIDDVMATIKTGEAQTRKNYRAEKVLERACGIPQDNSYKSAAMIAGSEVEAMARAVYAFEMDVDVVEVGFIPHPRIAHAGASPDGLINETGLIEIKCPQARAYLDAKLTSPIDRKYVLQMQFQMAVTGREWCDYVVYREGLPLIVQRITRDDALIREIEYAVQTFLSEVEAEYNRAFAK
jgi:putative phage-type endonuclease